MSKAPARGLRAVPERVEHLAVSDDFDGSTSREYATSLCQPRVSLDVDTLGSLRLDVGPVNLPLSKHRHAIALDAERARPAVQLDGLAGDDDLIRSASFGEDSDATERPHQVVACLHGCLAQRARLIPRPGAHASDPNAKPSRRSTTARTAP